MEYHLIWLKWNDIKGDVDENYYLLKAKTYNNALSKNMKIKTNPKEKW